MFNSPARGNETGVSTAGSGRVGAGNLWDPGWSPPPGSPLAGRIRQGRSVGSLPDTDFRRPGAVVARPDDVFQMERQNGKYFTTCCGADDRPARSLAYCNAAHPAALLLAGPARESAALKQLDSTDPMVGMLPPGVPFRTR